MLLRQTRMSSMRIKIGFFSVFQRRSVFQGNDGAERRNEDDRVYRVSVEVERKLKGEADVVCCGRKTTHY